MKHWYRNEHVSKIMSNNTVGQDGASHLGCKARVNRRSRFCRSLLAAVPLVSVALLAAACGSSSSTSSTSTTGGSGSTTTGASSTSGVSAALDALKAMPTFKPPGPAIAASKLSGSKIVTIDCAPNAAPPAQTTAGTVAAGKVAGINVTVLAGGNTDIPLDIQFIDQAINLKPIAIILAGCVPPLLTVPLQAAQTAGIPVIVADDMGPTVSAPGQGAGPLAFGVAAQPFSDEGTILAEQIAATGPKAAQIGFVSAQVIAGSPQIETAFKAGLAKYCPTCKLVDVQNVDPANWVTSLTSTVSSMLVAHPTMNYLIPVFDGMSPFIASALGSSANGKLVKVITTQGSTGAAMTNIQNGTFMSDIGTSSTWVGWVAIDQAMRGALKLAPEADPNIPIRLATTASLAGLDPKSDVAVYGDSYVQGFKTLWGIG